jgi:GT2 family glycosyltransferase
MDLAIIIVSWNVRSLLRSCLTSVYQKLADSARQEYELEAAIWVVDNNSADGSAGLVRDRFPEVRLIANAENRGFAAANNQGMEQALAAGPRYLILLNPDTAIRGRALEALVRYLDENPSVGMVGARLVYGDGSFQHSGFGFPGLAQIALDLFPLPHRLHETRLNGRYPRRWYAADAPPFPIDHPLGAAMMVRREVVESVGLMDTAFFMYCEEIDWAMRIRSSGWEIVCVPAAEIVHYGGQSSSQIPAESFANLWRSRRRLYHKHYSRSKARLAGWLVRWGIRSKMRKVNSEAFREAYRQVMADWS